MFDLKDNGSFALSLVFIIFVVLYLLFDDVLSSPYQVILKHFYFRKEETLAQCKRWKEELAEGIQRLQSKTINVQALNDYLRNITRLTETLKAELAKINPEDFASSE